MTYENVQAGERTSHLFRLANRHGALVLGTGDLSELALGWGTYGVGDHMSHYNVNASVPKTLIQFLVRWAIETDQFGAGNRRGARRSILDTAISPELIPTEDPDADVPDQHSEHDRRTVRARRTSSSITRSASATGRARSRGWRITRGATATPGAGRT